MRYLIEFDSLIGSITALLKLNHPSHDFSIDFATVSFCVCDYSILYLNYPPELLKAKGRKLKSVSVPHQNRRLKQEKPAGLPENNHLNHFNSDHAVAPLVAVLHLL